MTFGKGIFGEQYIPVISLMNDRFGVTNSFNLFQACFFGIRKRNRLDFKVPKVYMRSREPLLSGSDWLASTSLGEVMANS